MSWAVRCRLQVRFFLILLGKQLVIEHIFEYNRSMELGDSTTAERHQRSVVDEALDTFDAALTELISAVETSGLDHLEADQQVAVWQRFERIRNKLPLQRHDRARGED